MTAEPHGRQVRLEGDGEGVAADVEPLDDRNVVRANLHASARPAPADARRRLVDEVLDLPETREGRKLEATLPSGDTEALDQLRKRCQDVEARPAGATVLVDAELPAVDPSDDAPASPGTRTGRRPGHGQPPPTDTGQ